MRSLHKALVRWDDLDAMSHVNNAKYLTLAQGLDLNGLFILMSAKAKFLEF